MSDAEPVVVAEMVRSGMVESRHHGSVVALEPDGEVAFRAGRVSTAMYPRSTNKPAQAAAMVRMGMDLDGELLALASASHSGEEFHVEGARSILAKFGLDESDLQNTPQWPVDERARHSYVCQGNAKSSIVANCSGKHAAMLATCVVNGWPVSSYRDPSHPLQEAIKATVADLAGEPVAHTGTDGCGAPLFAISLLGVARMFRAIAVAGRDTPEGRVAAAIREFPEWVSGTTRDEARLIRAVPGLIGKGGAEGVYGVALDDGRAVALKIDDGAERVRPAVMEAALRRLGVEVQVSSDPQISLPDLGWKKPPTRRLGSGRALDA